MKLFTPTGSKRLNEATGFVFLLAGLYLLLAFATFRAADPSWDTAAGSASVENMGGLVGAWLADLTLGTFGLASFLLPLFLFALGWKWLRSEAVVAPRIRVLGAVLMVLSFCGATAMLPAWRVFNQAIMPGGLVGYLVADWLKGAFNPVGTVIGLCAGLIVSVYLVSSFTLEMLARWMAPFARFFAAIQDGWRRFIERRREAAIARTEQRRETAEARQQEQAAIGEEGRLRQMAVAAARQTGPAPASDAPVVYPGPIPAARRAPRPVRVINETLPWEESLPSEPEVAAAPECEPMSVDEIPICVLEATPLPQAVRGEFPFNKAVRREPPPRPHAIYKLPPTSLLNQIPVRSAFDEQELKDTAVAIKAKFEEFNVHGSVVQINPGPVVTTFEFKPDAGVKYSRITTLVEDLCLGLQAESILIERIPGKPTIGIEVPNTKREVISLRAVLESAEFEESPSRLTMSMGKDINGRIRVAALETMPHLLIAGSTGSGKSVMINSLIMSILYKSTPDEVRMIMVDPKRVELGMYEGIPHLLTPVITDPRKATNALKNAVLEMERRLRLMAEQGARNVDQYNKKIRALQNQPRNLFTESDDNPVEEPKPLPYILILIDELADLMMLEGRNVEESVTRLAQMARAVGMHLVLATQRPSVDVITGLIKANFPARISFRVATRVDSRTILDVMGAEHLLGKGDMLFLPPGSSRLVRVHGAFVTENETNEVVAFWKAQARPEYDQSYLLAPATEDGDPGESEAVNPEDQDPMYEEAMRVVMEMGKASTSTLQRRLRLGYGRAARILDMMYRDGIIGPPDGSKPREVLKSPEWLRELEHI